MPDLRIRFPAPGFFLGDAQLSIRVDEQAVYEGSFKSGMDVTVPVAPGAHVIDLELVNAPLRRKRRYELAVDGRSVTATLRYSRFWGSMTKKLDVSYA